MLPKLPLDVMGKMVRVGDDVVFGADNGSSLMTGKVVKITPCFVWISVGPSGYTFRRWCERVVVV